MANEKCKSYLNHVSPNNKAVLYRLSSCLVILCTLRKGGYLHSQTFTIILTREGCAKPESPFY